MSIKQIIDAKRTCLMYLDRGSFDDACEQYEHYNRSMNDALDKIEVEIEEYISSLENQVAAYMQTSIEHTEDCKKLKNRISELESGLKRMIYWLEDEVPVEELNKIKKTLKGENAD